MSISKHWTSLIKPEKIQFEKTGPNLDKIVISPLERGFGTTIGNALRRVLLSSMHGSAIVALQMPGILHEFSPIPGVEEDMVNLVLNLKSTKIKLNTKNRKQISLKILGPTVVTAMHLAVDEQITVLNPDHHICTITEPKEIEITLICENGKGYVPSDLLRDNEQGEITPGTIWIDALFSPINKVSFKVDEARVGQKIGYDKLVMHVDSYGALSPEMAIGLAAKILQDQLQTFISFDVDVQEESSIKESKPPFDLAILKKIDEIDMTVRSQNCLKNANIVYIGDLVVKTEAEMLKTPNFGRKSLNEIREILSLLGLKFGMKIPEWPPENLEDLAQKYKTECF
jgi:DNA-directed RNA polymerase subunit alpha